MDVAAALIAALLIAAICVAESLHSLVAAHPKLCYPYVPAPSRNETIHYSEEGRAWQAKGGARARGGGGGEGEGGSCTDRARVMKGSALCPKTLQ